MIWIITDTHFNHTNIQEFCDRPDNAEERMVKALWAVPEEDTLVHLGDVCLGGDVKTHLELIDKLPCTKILVRGNHDRRSNNWYTAHGWHFVCRSFRDHFGGKDILFSHVPVERPLFAQKGDSLWDLNIHGHCHNNKRDVMDDKYHLLLAVETNLGYKPMKIDTILKKFGK